MKWICGIFLTVNAQIIIVDIFYFFFKLSQITEGSEGRRHCAFAHIHTECDMILVQI